MTDLSVAGIRGGLLAILTQGLSVVARVLGLVVLGRLLQPEVFGVVAIVSSLSAFLTAFVLMGLGMAAVQAANLSRNAESALFYVNSALGLGCATLFFFAAGGLASLYENAVLQGVVRWLSLIPILAGLSVQYRMRLVRALRFGTLAAIEIPSQFLAVLVAIGLAANGAQESAVVAQLVIEPLLQLILLMAVARWLPNPRVFLTGEVKELLRIGRRVLVMNLARNVSRAALVPALGYVSTAAAVGQFDRAQQLAVTPINLTVDQLQRVAVPVLSRLKDDPTMILSYMRRAQMIGCYLTATTFLLIAALGEPLIKILMGARWSEAGILLQVLALGAMFRALGQTMNWVFVAGGGTREGMMLSLWSQPAIVLMSLAGLPWGVMGVATGSSVAWAIYWPVATLVAARAAGFSAKPLLTDVVSALRGFAVPVAAAAAATRLVHLNSATETVAFGVTAALVVGALCLVVAGQARRDLYWTGRALREAVFR